MTHTPIDIAALEAMVKAATPGPWEDQGTSRDGSKTFGYYIGRSFQLPQAEIDVGDDDDGWVFSIIGRIEGLENDQNKANSAFIAALRNAAPELIKAVKERDEWKNQAHILRDNLQRTEEVLGAHSLSAEFAIASLRALLAEARKGLLAMIAEWEKLTRYGSPLAKAANENLQCARASIASLDLALREIPTSDAKPLDFP